MSVHQIKERMAEHDGSSNFTHPETTNHDGSCGMNSDNDAIQTTT